MGAENRIDSLGEEGCHSLGKMLKALFGTPFGTGALTTLRTLILPRPSQGWLTWVRWQCQEVKPHATSTISVTAEP